MRSQGLVRLGVRAHWGPWLGLVLATGLGCGDVTGGQKGPFRFDFLTGMPPADTIYALPNVTVLVVLRDGAGRPTPNVGVLFETPGARLFLQDLDGPGQDPTRDTTDAEGRAGVLVLRGATSGVAWLRVRAPSLALADSLPFEILPGNPVEIRLIPADTALRVGATFTLRGRVLDWLGNARPEPVSFSAESTAVSVNESGGSAAVTGLAFGRASVLAVGAGVTRRAWVSVVPSGTIAFFVRAFYTDDSIAIATSSTDGTNYVALWASPFDYASSRPLDWAPDGQSLVFHLGTNSQAFRLYRITLLGAVQRVIAHDIGGYPEMYPRFGPDGWIYFTAQIDGSIGTDELWRVRADGSSPQRIGPAAAAYESDTYAAPAPDGLRVWFSTDRPSPGVDPVTLASLELGTGTVTYLGFYGIGAVWSPVGDRAAFIDRVGAIIITVPDGSGQRVVSMGNRAYEPYIDWSPDGKWIVASGPDGVDIIEPDLGITLPLAFAKRWRHPAWRP